MHWFKYLIKTAHAGEMLEGQLMQKEAGRLKKEISELKEKAASKQIEVLPRWKMDVERKIALLPAVDRIDRMCMYELEQLSSMVDEVKNTMRDFNPKRWESNL